MATISVFSTQETLDNINNQLDLADKAIHEAQLGVTAKIPDAEKMLQQAEAVKEHLQLIKQTYFPGGVVPKA